MGYNRQRNNSIWSGNLKGEKQSPSTGKTVSMHS